MIKQEILKPTRTSNSMSTDSKITDRALASGFSLLKAENRGIADHGWLKSAHSFSFANYFNPEYLHFESLRVINDDRVAATRGFPMHPHQNFEIFSYILEGSLEHRDSMGNGSVVKEGGVQYMSAGSGVTHSEFNPSSSEASRFLQIWLLPNVKDEKPVYQTLDIRPEDKDGKLKLFLSGDGRNGSIRVKSDAEVHAATLNGDQEIIFEMPETNKAWIQVASGRLTVNGTDLEAGDGLAISVGGRLEFANGRDAEFLLFDLQPLPH